MLQGSCIHLTFCNPDLLQDTQEKQTPTAGPHPLCSILLGHRQHGTQTAPSLETPAQTLKASGNFRPEHECGVMRRKGLSPALTLTHLQDSADTSRMYTGLCGGWEGICLLWECTASSRGAAPFLLVLHPSGACVGACNRNGQCLGDWALALLCAELSTMDGRLPRLVDIR